MKLEKLKTSDAAQVYEIEKLSFSDPHSLTSILSSLNNPACRFWVVKDGENVAGFAEFWIMYDESHVIDIAVRPHLRRTGLGSKLMELIIEKSREAGAKKIFLEVRPSNTAARALYEKYGFAEAGRRVKYYKDEDAVIMCREL